MYRVSYLHDVSIFEWVWKCPICRLLRSSRRRGTDPRSRVDAVDAGGGDRSRSLRRDFLRRWRWIREWWRDKHPFCTGYGEYTVSSDSNHSVKVSSILPLRFFNASSFVLLILYCGSPSNPIPSWNCAVNCVEQRHDDLNRDLSREQFIMIICIGISSWSSSVLNKLVCRIRAVIGILCAIHDSRDVSKSRTDEISSYIVHCDWIYINLNLIAIFFFENTSTLNGIWSRTALN